MIDTRDKMKIYSTQISADATEAINTCIGSLSNDERLRSEELSDRVRTRYIVSRAFRRQILGKDAEILTEEKGRPYLKGDPFFFSMSHSGDLVVMSVGDNPVGIDIELMKYRSFAKLSEWFFGESISDREAFYRRWTQYEAGLKLAGQTLFSQDVPEPKYIHSEIIGGYMLSIASNYPIALPLVVVAM